MPKWKLMPTELTQHMTRAVTEGDHYKPGQPARDYISRLSDEEIQTIYRRLLEAAPQSPDYTLTQDTKIKYDV
jgi:hypothetical protein